MKTRAQLTLFIILGFVIALGVILVYFFQSQETENILETEFSGTASTDGQKELRNFMDACLKESTFQGLELLRIQAGYIEIPPTVPTALVDMDRKVINVNGLKKVKEEPSSVLVPYWLDSDNGLHVPTTAYIEQSLADYIKASMIQCINDFSSFKEQNYEVEAGDMQVTAQLSEEVFIKIDYPVKFTQGQTSFSEDFFNFRVPINLQKAINLQTDIVLAEYLGSYLEDDILYLISLYSYGGGEKENTDLPPISFTDASTSCKMVTWKTDEVEEKLASNLVSNLQYVRLKYHDPFPVESDNDISTGVYRGLTNDMLEAVYDNTNVGFSFNKNGYILDMAPSSSGILKPTRNHATGIPFLPAFCNFQYRFKYSLRFPLTSTVTLLDSPALDLKGYVLDYENPFSFDAPIGIFLCGNQKRQCTGLPAYALEQENIDLSGLDFDVTNSLFCNDDARISKPVTITAKDSFTGEVVSDAAFFYRCGAPENECLIDVTDQNGVLAAKFPICNNGELFAMKEGYSPSTIALTTSAQNPVEKEFIMDPVKTLDLEVVPFDVETFLKDYYMTDGFTTDKCSGNLVDADSAVNALALKDWEITINSKAGPTTILAVYPQHETVDVAAGGYLLSVVTMGTIEITPSRIGDDDDHIIISANQQTGLSRVSDYPIGKYDNMFLDVDTTELKAANKVTIYAPVEKTKDTMPVADIQNNLIQSDGSMYLVTYLDTDCNPSTDEQYVAINVSKKDVQRIIAPRLG